MLLTGIHCEGYLDELITKVLIKRILREEGVDSDIEFRVSHADTGLTDRSIKAAVSLFGDIKPPCNLAVFITDQDGNTDKLRNLTSMIKNQIDGLFDDYAILACPEPNIENWLLKEEDAIKNIFLLDAANQLPESNISEPKARLKTIIKIFNKDLTKNHNDICFEITKLLNISKLKSVDRSFDCFHSSLVSKIRRNISKSRKN